MKKYVIFIILIAVVLTYLFLPSGDDTREIGAILDQAAQSVKEKDLDGVMEHFSLNYRDEYGATYPVVKNIVNRFFDKFDSFDVQYSDLKASISETDEGGKQAVTNFDVQVSGIKSGIPSPILGESAAPANITATLRKSTLGGWKVIKVDGIEGAEGQF